MTQLISSDLPVFSFDALNQVDRDVAKLANALGHPARVAIVRLLRQHGSCVCGEIVQWLPLAQSTVSQHLKVLKEAGWIIGEVEGACVCYCFNHAMLARYNQLFTVMMEIGHES